MTERPSITSALLRGCDHTDLDRIAATAVSPGLAIALSRGREPKRYHYTDPNEDIVGATAGEESVVLVAADGHNGWSASHQAAPMLLERMTAWRTAPSRREMVLVFHEINAALHDARAGADPAQGRSRTTLSLALVRRDDHGQRYLTHATVGDSPVLVIRDRRTYRVSKDRHRFLGNSLSAPQVAGSMDYGQTDLGPHDVVVVVTDGYTNFARAGDIARLLQPTAEQSARRIIDHAGEQGAGDNVAVAVLFGDGPAHPADA
ncbi:PP2C family protein-serine/threonine phosphatase [Euzebya tangerina]|uniref:PP2C family protein-serine/threonine phosphatase n=1 Tax=Euzebya tangerina TaxID=591198 RepID=UPI0013C2FBCF|nr:protein phosphatase 2C domain-containing protein [Euzebya tangerina]